MVERSAWKSRFRKLGPGRGLGLACGSYLCGAGLPIYFNKMPQSAVQLLVDRSGQVTAFCGATEIGQGSDDVLAAIIAEVLGIDPFDIRCVTGDTGITPVDLGSYSSRVTVMMGNAAIEASNKVKNWIAQATAEQLEVAPDKLVFANGRVAFDGRSVTFAEAVSFAEEKFERSVRSAPTSRRARRDVTRAPAWTFAGLLVHRVRGGSRGRSRYRLDHRAEDLDRARHRPHHQPGARARAGRGQRLHGPVRGAHGRTGVSPPAAEARARSSTRFLRSSNTRASLRSTCRKWIPCSSRIRIRTARSARRKWGRDRFCR